MNKFPGPVDPMLL